MLTDHFIIYTQIRFLLLFVFAIIFTCRQTIAKLKKKKKYDIILDQSLELIISVCVLYFLVEAYACTLVIYLIFLFHFTSSARTRSFDVLRHRATTMSHSFAVRGGLIWKSLSYSVKSLSSLGRFNSTNRAFSRDVMGCSCCGFV
jgi:hypothetical protein